MKAKRNPRVTGTSTIIHRIRRKLGLTCDEYVVLDYLRIRYMDSSITMNDVYNDLGYSPEELKSVFSTLKKKEKIVSKPDGIKGKAPVPYKNFMDEFDNVNDAEEQFEKLWLLNKSGSKVNAKKKFKKVLELVDFETLYKAKVAYVKNCKETSTYLKNMETWLNPESRHWENNLRPVEKDKKEPVIKMKLKR